MSEQGPGWLGPYDWLMWITALGALLQILLMILRCCRRSNRNIGQAIQDSSKYLSDNDPGNIANFNRKQLELAQKRADLIFKRMKIADLIGKNKNKHLDDMDGMFGKAKNLVGKI